MKRFSIVAVLLIIILFIISTFSKTGAMQHYEEVGFSTGLVTASALNVRQGPGTKYKVVTQVYKNEYIRVFAKIGNWYVIQTDNDIIGAVSKDYVKAIYPTGGNTNNGNTSSGNTNSNNSSSNTNNKGLTADEQEVLDLINAQRTKNGLSKLTIDSEVQAVARDKAKDMVQNNYFSHNSPTYGTPFEMLKSYKVSYKTAGENIAGNSSNAGAVNAWMNSAGHKENILNNAYNYTGIAVVESSKYGKIYVQMFIGR